MTHWIEINCPEAEFEISTELSICFFEDKKREEMYVTIHLGKNILERMGLKIGDPVSVFYDADFPKKFLIQMNSSSYEDSFQLLPSLEEKESAFLPFSSHLKKNDLNETHFTYSCRSYQIKPKRIIINAS